MKEITQKELFQAVINGELEITNPGDAEVGATVETGEGESFYFYAARPQENVEFLPPTPAMLTNPLFNAIWDAIKSWDVAVPEEMDGSGLYSGATGNHARLVMDSILSKLPNLEPLVNGPVCDEPITSGYSDAEPLRSETPESTLITDAHDARLDTYPKSEAEDVNSPISLLMRLKEREEMIKADKAESDMAAAMIARVIGEMLGYGGLPEYCDGNCEDCDHNPERQDKVAV